MKKNRLIFILLIIFTLFTLSACKKEQITINLDPNGGNIESTSISISKGNTTSLPIPTKEDKTFLGWFDNTGNQITNETKIDENITLYAKWDKYKIVFLNDEKIFSVLEENVDELISYPSSTPTKDPDQDYYYKFVGWDVNENTIITSDMQINAIYEQDAIKWAIPQGGINPFQRSMFKLSYIYRDGLFDQPTTTFSKDLALFAFGAANSTASDQLLSSFYSSIDFDDIFVSESYSQAITKDSICYLFAHRKINNNDIICVTVRGRYYEKEWANNFLLGRSDNHDGFYNSAIKIYNDLEQYLQKYDSSSLKVLINGYSRGGAVANALAHKILTTSTILNTNNLYVYTFEAPASIDARGDVNYPNVFNVVNSADIVTQIPPLKYGLKRCGIDIEIYNSEVDNLLSSNGALFKLPAFTSSSDYANEIQFTNYIITTLTSYTGSNPSLNTRNEYYINYQDAICYLVEMIFGLKSQTLDNITTDLSSRSTLELMGLLSGDGLFNYLNNFIKADGISYSEIKLKNACAIISKLINGPAMPLITSLSSSSNLMRMLQMHQFEVTYSLLVGYEK